MPVMPRNFCFQMVASLCKSCECGSLSLFVGRASSWVPIHRVYPSRAWSVWNIIGCLSWFYCSALRASRPSVWVWLQRVTYCLASPGAEVMIGNSVLEQAATHNHFLPIITQESLLGLQDHWCFWSFGARVYQLLPIFTMVLIWAGSWPISPLPTSASGPTHRHRHT